ncbi:MAG: xanthine dehydrogenase family protein molybdopterin-binding subunit, partial [Deltaproteobacteria bacterium]|nr:xanthine dehydrogenase family protein molybdopterin-binding subunit [Deltaproteobacteria bacterium]
MSIEIPGLPEDMPGAELKYVGKDVKRIEDPGLVAGTVEFIDNLDLPNMAHCAMLRSPHPHARITGYDTSAAEALPGVVAVITGEDVKRWANPVTTAPEGWGSYCLAVDKVRFVGEPVVAVAAESRYIAEDALELVNVEYELLPVAATAEEAIKEGAPRLFEENESNVILSKTYDWGDVDQVFADADHV